MKDDKYNFHLKERETKEKMILVTMKMDNDPKCDEVMQYIKQAVHLVSQLKNWIDGSAMARMIDVNGMTWREDFGETGKWMCQPKVVGKGSKNMQNIFKVQTQLSVK